MELESDPNTNFESVDMAIFFWIGIAFIILYRVCVFMWAVYNWLCRGDGDWYDVILCLFDLYIFKAVYESFSEAQGVITKNAAKREKNRQIKEQKRKQKQMERTVELTEAGKNAQEIEQILQEEEEQELEPGGNQFFLQLGESVVEAMPQIVLQCVFIIRSGNDPELVKESNIWLVLLSIIASLFSIASKFIFLDKNFVYEKAKSLKFSPNCPRCTNYWYLCRLMWRMSHVVVRFSVFVLLWTVLGGRWLPIFLFSSWVFWTIYACWWQKNDDDADPEEAVMISIIFIVAVLPLKRELCYWLTIRSIENMFAMVLVTIFAAMKFKCQFNFCSEPDDRQLIGNDNERVLIFWSLGWLSLIVEALLFAVMYLNEIFVSDEQYFDDENHGKYLKMSGKYNQTVTVDKSKLRSDDPDIDLPNSAYFYVKRALKHSSPAVDHKIRIDTLSNKGNDDIVIGIAGKSQITNESFVIDPKVQFYAYSNAGNAIKSVEIPAEEQQTERYYVETKISGDGYGEGDVVTIRCNPNTKNLQYFVNDKEQCSFECGSDLYAYYHVISLRNHGDAISVIGTKFARGLDILRSTDEMADKKPVPGLVEVDEMLHLL